MREEGENGKRCAGLRLLDGSASEMRFSCDWVGLQLSNIMQDSPAPGMPRSHRILADESLACNHLTKVGFLDNQSPVP